MKTRVRKLVLLPEVAWVVDELRAIGLALVDGSWRRGAAPITVPESISVMAQAARIVLGEGVRSMMRELSRLAGPSDE